MQKVNWTMFHRSRTQKQTSHKTDEHKGGHPSTSLLRVYVIEMILFHIGMQKTAKKKYLHDKLEALLS